MATLYGRKRKRVQKIQSGSRYAEVFGPPMPSIPVKLQAANVEAGWGCVLNAQGKGTSTSKHDAMFGIYESINKRFRDAEGNLCQPVLLRGVAYTHRDNLTNAGDIKGNLLCLGTNGEEVDPGGVGNHRMSRIVIVGKRKYRD